MPDDDPAGRAEGSICPVVCPYCGKPCGPTPPDHWDYGTRTAEIPGQPGHWYHLRCFQTVMDSAFKAVDL